MLQRSFPPRKSTYLGRASAPLLAPLMAVGLLLAAPASTALAQTDFDRTTARTLGQEGHAALDRNDFAAAADAFSRAEALVHAPTFLLGFAQAEVGRGRLVSALEAYNRILREELSPKAPPAFVKAVETARTEFDALQPRIPYVLIQVKTPAGATAPVKVTIDGVDVPRAALGVKRAVDAGQHTITAGYEGQPPATATLTVAEGRTESVTLEPKGDGAGLRAPGDAHDVTPPPDTSGSGSTRRTVGIVGMALGGAGLIVGAAMGGAVLAKHSSLSKSCPGGKCPIADEPTLQSSVNQYHAFATASTVGFIAGGVLAAAGIVIFVTAPKSSAPPGPAVGLVVRPTWAGVGGSF